MIRNAVFRHGEEAELTLKAQNAPRIGKRTALNAPMEEVFDFHGHLGGPLELALVDGQVSGREPALDLRGHPRRSHWHDVRLPQCRFGMAHLRKHQRQVHVFELRGAPASQLLIQVLPRAGQRLFAGHGFSPEPLAVRPRELRNERLVEGITIGGDARQQRAQRRRRIVRVGPTAAGAGGHQYRAGQYDRGFQ